MKKTIFLLVILLLTSCNNSFNEEVVVREKTDERATEYSDTIQNFSSYDEAVDYIENSNEYTHESVDTSKSSYVNSADYYYLATEDKGYAIFKLKGKKYIHSDVPREVWEGFKKANSFGSYYNDFFKGNYQFNLII